MQISGGGGGDGEKDKIKFCKKICSQMFWRNMSRYDIYSQQFTLSQIHTVTNTIMPPEMSKLSQQ